MGIVREPVVVDRHRRSRPSSEQSCDQYWVCLLYLEFDKIPLSEQLRVISSGGLRRTDEILQHFKDYRGFEVIYGGRKSLHFHFIFDLRHWSHDLAFENNSSYQDHWLADFPDTYLREAHEDRWYVVERAFCRGTGIEAELDDSLRLWGRTAVFP